MRRAPIVRHLRHAAISSGRSAPMRARRGAPSNFAPLTDGATRGPFLSARLMMVTMLLSQSADSPTSSFRRETVPTHNNCADDRIFLEILRSLNRQQLGKFRSGSIDSALHSTRGTSAHLRRLGIGKPGRSNQYESPALLGRQLNERGAELVVLGWVTCVGLDAKRSALSSMVSNRFRRLHCE
jgi:hypothetical protein